MQYVLSHRHDAGACEVAYAAWKGFESPLRHRHALGSCAADGADSTTHLLVWTVEAESEPAALALLPPWLAERTEARRMDEVAIP